MQLGPRLTNELDARVISEQIIDEVHIVLSPGHRLLAVFEGADPIEMKRGGRDLLEDGSSEQHRRLFVVDEEDANGVVVRHRLRVWGSDRG